MSGEGVLIRAVSSFYDLETENRRILRCRARGHLRLGEVEPLPGDRVRYELDPFHPDSGILTDVLPRKNAMIRPSIANVDQILFIATGAKPRTLPYLIDRISVSAEEIGTKFVLCLNKCDLDLADQLYQIYSGCGYTVLRTSAVSGEGIEELRSILSGKLSVLTGNSGVGKTSLLNRLLPDVMEKTGEINQKHGRGRHTTRRTELFPLPDGGWLADTPGFSALELRMISALEPQMLGSCFPEFPLGKCRFQDCLHSREPDCAVRSAVSAHKISMSRYQSYLRMLEELNNSERSS